MTNNATSKKELAGFLRQILIISWKNLLLYKTNIAGIVCEFLFPFLFLSITYFVFYLAIGFSKTDSFFSYNSMVVSTPVNTNEEFFWENRKFFYYPNNEFIRSILVDSLGNNRLPIGINTSDPKDFLKEHNISITRNGPDYNFIIFPRHHNSWNDFSNRIEYTIYSSE